jgi:ribosomal protein S18 acetylase RimI-like enzyme
VDTESVLLSEVDPGSPAVAAAVDRYYAELARRFATGFDPASYGAGSAADPGQRVVLATRADVVVGCATLRPLQERVVEIKRMWVDPQVRGVGLGRRLLVHLEGLAVQDGCRAIRLDTNGALTEAIALYERHGYRRIPRYNDNPYAEVWFEKLLD